MILTAEQAVAAYADMQSMLRSNMHDCNCASFFLQTPMVLPRLALGKWQLHDENGHHRIDTGEGSIILPGITPGEYVAHINSALTPGAKLLRVPAWIAARFKKTKFKAAAATTEYILSGTNMVTMAGPTLKRMRNYRNSAADKVLVSVHRELNALDKQAVRDLNDAWYRDANTRMFRTYEKRNIDWLLSSWGLATDIDPDLRISLIRSKETGALLVYQIGTVLTNGMSTFFTERYDRQGIRGANIVGLSELTLALKQMRINDGTADSPAIRQIKEKFSGGETIKTFNIEVPRR